MGCKHNKGQSCLAGCVQEPHPTAPHHLPLPYTRYAKAFRGFYSPSPTPVLPKILQTWQERRSGAACQPFTRSSKSSEINQLCTRSQSSMANQCFRQGLLVTCSISESGTSTHFPPLLEEQGRTDPNSSGQLPAGQRDGAILPKAPAKAEGSAAHPEPEDGLQEVLAPSRA